MGKDKEIMLQLQIDGGVYEYPKGTVYADIVRDFREKYDHDIVLVMMDGYLRELHHRVHASGRLEMVTTADQIGHETYRRSCSMLFLAALRDVAGQEAADKAVLHFTVGHAFYYTIYGIDAPSDDLLTRIEERMREMVSEALPIKKQSVPLVKAKAMFRERGMTDKEKLFRTRLSSSINLYRLGDYEDYYYGFMTNHTGYLKYFKLYRYENGILLQMPPGSDPEALTPPKAEAELFKTQIEGEKIAEAMGIPTIGDLNETIISQNTREMILTSEALQESRIARIADEITARPSVKFVMIAGPSSSGKTTFSQRLCIQLRARGLKPHYVGVDNYFKNREDTPKLPNGQYDFECLGAVDVAGFNKDMLDLLSGKVVKMPTFDFREGVRVYKGDTLQLKADDLLVIEGIHCLNDELSTSLPRESKFKVYISALTQLNVDEHNRIPSTDGRLIRRMVRDSRTRGYSAVHTLGMWPVVRHGEEQYIFPFQGTADVIFNSALPYELAVLKQYVHPLLLQVQPEDAGFYEAKRLLKFLDYIIGLPAEDVPANSILREFIGGGCYHL